MDEEGEARIFFVSKRKTKEIAQDIDIQIIQDVQNILITRCGLTMNTGQILVTDGCLKLDIDIR